MKKHPDRLDEIAKAVDTAKDSPWSSDYYLLSYRARTLMPRLRGPRVLDLGCAEGGMTIHLARAFDKVVAVDGSEHVLNKARAHVLAENVEFRCSLFEEFKADGQFDSIVMACILEHVEDPVAVLSRAKSWLAPGGHIHMTVPNAGALNRRVGVALGLLKRVDELHSGDLRQGHCRVYSLETLTADVKRAGLEVVHTEGIFLKPLSDAQMKSWDARLLEAFYEVGKDMSTYCTEIYVEARPVPHSAS